MSLDMEDQRKRLAALTSKMSSLSTSGMNMDVSKSGPAPLQAHERPVGPTTFGTYSKPVADAVVKKPGPMAPYPFKEPKNPRQKDIRMLHYDQGIRKAFQAYSEREFSLNNLNFTLEVEKLRKMYGRNEKERNAIQAKCQEIYNRFLMPSSSGNPDSTTGNGAPEETNLPSDLITAVKQEANNGKFKVETFLRLQKNIEAMMSVDTYSRFLASEDGNKAILAAEKTVKEYENALIREKQNEALVRFVSEHPTRANPFEYIKIISKKIAADKKISIKNVSDLLNNVSSGRIFSSSGFPPIPQTMMTAGSISVLKKEFKPDLPINKANVANICDIFSQIDRSLIGDVTVRPNQWVEFWDEQRKTVQDPAKIREMQINVLSSYRYKVCMDLGLDAESSELMQMINTDLKEALLKDKTYDPDEVSPLYPNTDEIAENVRRRIENKLTNGINGKGDYETEKQSKLNDKVAIIIGPARVEEIVNKKFLDNTNEPINQLIKDSEKFIADETARLAVGGISVKMALSDEFRKVYNMQVMVDSLKALRDKQPPPPLEGLLEKYKEIVEKCQAAQVKATGTFGLRGKSEPLLDVALKSLNEIKPIKPAEARARTVVPTTIVPVFNQEKIKLGEYAEAMRKDFSSSMKALIEITKAVGASKIQLTSEDAQLFRAVSNVKNAFMILSEAIKNNKDIHEPLAGGQGVIAAAVQSYAALEKREKNLEHGSQELSSISEYKQKIRDAAIGLMRLDATKKLVGERDFDALVKQAITPAMDKQNKTRLGG